MWAQWEWDARPGCVGEGGRAGEEQGAAPAPAHLCTLVLCLLTPELASVSSQALNEKITDKETISEAEAKGTNLKR